VAYINQPDLPFPFVTICNWNQQYDANFCQECQTTLISCTNNSIYASGDETDCSSDWTFFNYGNYNDVSGLFFCYQWNGTNVLTNITGYAGSQALVFQVSRNVTQIQQRIGLQVSFSNGTTPPNLYDEVRYSPIDYDSFYALQQLLTVVVNYSIGDNTTSLVFTTTSSTIHLPLLNETDPTVGYVGVSFAYQELSIESITYQVQYGFTNFFGDFAGMFGTLCGLDVLKLMAGARLIPKAIHRKSCFVLQDHFNG